MNLNFRNLPVGNLPYDNIQLCKKMMLRLYENLPFLPDLPKLNADDNIITRTIANMPCISVKDKKILLPDSTNDSFLFTIDRLESIYNSTNPSDFNSFYSDSSYLSLFMEMIKKFKPEFTVISLMGIFSFADAVFNKGTALLITDKYYRKFIAQSIAIKAMWYIYAIKDISPNTTPIIVFDESALYKFGTLKRNDESITNETITTLLAKPFDIIRKSGALVAVQSFNKCNWQLIFDTQSVDMISHDLYNNPDNLSIIASSVNKFLAKGGIINWGIVPVMNEKVIRGINLDMLLQRFKSNIENLASRGVSLDLLYRNATVSVQGNLANIPIIFAEKALILASQLAKKIPASSAE